MKRAVGIELQESCVVLMMTGLVFSQAALLTHDSSNADPSGRAV
jgi:hypothetical protein